MHFVLSFPSEPGRNERRSFQCVGFNALRAFIPLRTEICPLWGRGPTFQCTSCFHSPPNAITRKVKSSSGFCFNALRAFIPLRTEQTMSRAGERMDLFQCTSCFHSPPNHPYCAAAPISFWFQCTSCFHSPPNAALLVVNVFQKFQCTSCFHSPPNSTCRDPASTTFQVSMHFVLSFPSERSFSDVSVHVGNIRFNALRAFIPLRTFGDRSANAAASRFNALRAFIPLRTR